MSIHTNNITAFSKNISCSKLFTIYHDKVLKEFVIGAFQALMVLPSNLEFKSMFMSNSERPSLWSIKKVLSNIRVYIYKVEMRTSVCISLLRRGWRWKTYKQNLKWAKLPEQFHHQCYILSCTAKTCGWKQYLAVETCTWTKFFPTA